jgi:hypothetical protein
VWDGGDEVRLTRAAGETTFTGDRLDEDEDEEASDGADVGWSGGIEDALVATFIRIECVFAFRRILVELYDDVMILSRTASASGDDTLRF